MTLSVVLFPFPGGGVAQGREAAVELAQTSGTIREIVIEGAQRIEPGTVSSYLVVKVGDAFEPQRINRSLKSLFATGLFADVTIRRRGETLIVSVVENPVINRIAFEGNSALDNDILSAEVSLRPRVIYTRTKVQNDVKRILTLYRQIGRFAASVDPKIIQLPQNRVDLVFEIGEGEPTEVRSIKFVGNREFSDSDLRAVIRTKESAWWRLLTTDDAYDPDRLTLDRELMRRHYLSDGYADFRVLSAVAELTPNRKDFFITFVIDEGQRYEFGKVGVEVRLRDLKEDDMDGVIAFSSGEWYDATEVDKAIDDLTDKVGELGYAFVDVRPRIVRDRETRAIDVIFEINEGPRIFVERIDIVGNVRTLDQVIRREFRLVEGDAFNVAKLRRSRQRIRDLDFFEVVIVEDLPGSAPDKAVIKVEVEEKSTGSISVGAGFSTSSGPIVEIGLSEKNFLGKGQDLRVSFLIAASRSQLDFSFTEPFFLDRDIRAGFDVFRVTEDLQDFSSIDTSRTGFSLRAGYPITEKLTQAWRYELKETKISDVSSTASSLIQDQKGSEYLSEITHRITYDTRDSRLIPTKGYFTDLSTSVAGLGGSVRHLRNVLRAAKFYSVTDDWILSAGGSVGYILGIGDEVQFLERFFIGGDDLRGFATSGVGPRDLVTDDSLGGEWMYTGRLELSFPLGFLPPEFTMKGRLFTDLGSTGRLEPTNSNVGDTGSLRLSVGTGLTWNSPFGPLGVDVGFPVVSEAFDVEELVRVNFGTRF